MHTPSWFQDGMVVVSTARTCGINKDGHELYVVDPETGRHTDDIADELLSDAQAIVAGKATDSVQHVPLATVAETGIAVPVYYDRRYHEAFLSEVGELWPDYRVASLSALIESKELIVLKGHGSPSSDLRTGSIPYIKVSDLRAGFVNINPTNMVPEVVAWRFWGGNSSGLRAFDLICPERASKNIGDFCVLMPGQERIVLTKEVLIFRPGPKALFNPFYLLWAMSLKVVRQQWRRVVFMQTNREDVGKRYLEIEVPIAPTREAAGVISASFRDYFQGVAALRDNFRATLDRDGLHHVHLGVAEDADTVDALDSASSP